MISLFCALFDLGGTKDMLLGHLSCFLRQSDREPCIEGTSFNSLTSVTSNGVGLTFSGVIHYRHWWLLRPKSQLGTWKKIKTGLRAQSLLAHHTYIQKIRK